MSDKLEKRMEALEATSAESINKIEVLEADKLASGEKIETLESAQLESADKVVSLEKAISAKDEEIKQLKSDIKKAGKAGKEISIAPKKKKEKVIEVPAATMTVEINEEEVEVKFNLAMFILHGKKYLSQDIVSSGNVEVIAELIEMESEIISIV